MPATKRKSGKITSSQCKPCQEACTICSDKDRKKGVGNRVERAMKSVPPPMMKNMSNPLSVSKDCKRSGCLVLFMTKVCVDISVSEQR